MSDDNDEFNRMIGANDDEAEALRRASEALGPDNVRRLHEAPDDTDFPEDFDDDFGDMDDSLSGDDLSAEDDAGSWPNDIHSESGEADIDDGLAPPDELVGSPAPDQDAEASAFGEDGPTAEEMAAFAKKKKKILMLVGAVAVIGALVVTLFALQPAPRPAPAPQLKQAAPAERPAPEPSTTAIAAPETMAAAQDSINRPGPEAAPPRSVAETTPSAPPAKEGAVASARAMDESQVELSTFSPPASLEKPDISPLLKEQYVRLQEEVQALKGDLARLQDSSQSTSTAVGNLEELNRSTQRNFDELFRQMQALQASIGQLDRRQAQASMTKESITADRIRLGNFNIIRIDGTRTVHAHSPSNKRVTLVEGEQVRIGPDTFSVQRVYKDQNVALIGDRWFIDVHRAQVGPEERALRREPASMPVAALGENNIIESATDAGRLTLSRDYEVRAVTNTIAYLRHCGSKSEKIYRMGEELAGHGRVRAITANEVVSDRSVFRFNSCL